MIRIIRRAWLGIAVALMAVNFATVSAYVNVAEPDLSLIWAILGDSWIIGGILSWWAFGALLLFVGDLVASQIARNARAEAAYWNRRRF
jgi:hypothetical protein